MTIHSRNSGMTSGSVARGSRRVQQHTRLAADLEQHPLLGVHRDEWRDLGLILLIGVSVVGMMVLASL